MYFILPKIHNFVDKSKELETDSPRKYVHVIDGYAIVSNSIIVAVDLREFIKTELKIETEAEFNELTELIDWFNGKSFSFEFWNEFVKQSFVSLKADDCLEIELSSFNKQMIWEDPYVSQAKLKSSLKQIIDNICREGQEIERVAVNAAYYSLVSSAFSKEMKTDSLIFLFIPDGNAIKFTFYRRDYIFGMIPLDNSAITSITAFSIDSLFQDKIQKIYDGIEVEEIEDFKSNSFEDENQEEEKEDLFSNIPEAPKHISDEIPKPPKRTKKEKVQEEQAVEEEQQEESPFGDDEPDLS